MSRALDLHNNGDCANTPWCRYCVREEEAEKQDETLGPCGCVDYHMADCPINTDRFEYSPLDESNYEGDDERDWYTRSLNGDY